MLSLRAQATDGKWYAYDVTQTTAQQIGRALGAGYGACEHAPQMTRVFPQQPELAASVPL
jgi:hypothetical protein